MIRSSAILLAALLAAVAPLCAQGTDSGKDKDSGKDRRLEEMDAKLQEQRAAAVRSRLVLYTDELEKLLAQFTASGETVSAAAVKAELDAVQRDMRQLAGIARRQADPPAPGELQKGEELSPTALAARRIDKIIERFSASKATARPASAVGSLAARQRLLKFDKAVRNMDRLENGSRAYWGYDGAYALWSLTDMTPGDYDVVLRYSADAESGGKAVVKIAGAKYEVNIPKGTKNPREMRPTAGTVTIKEPGVDVRVESAGLADKANALWNLDSVILQPAAKRP